MTITARAQVGLDGEESTHQVSGLIVQHQGIEPDGNAVTVTTTSPGENAMVSFHGVGGRRIFLKVSEVNIGTSPCCSVRISAWEQGNQWEWGPTSLGRNGGIMDTQTLPQTNY